MTTRILLVRHGQSEWNAQGRWQGQADPPLSELGRQQAFRAASRIGSVDVIVSSDLQRALHTAQIISGQIGVGPVVVEPLFRERDAGEWSGLTRDEIVAGWPGYLEEHRRPPSVETDESVRARTAAALANVEREYRGAEVLVLTHGGLVYELERDHGQPWERLPNLGGRAISLREDRVEVHDRILLVDGDDITTVPAQI
jgi:broad specificity phosphatase PhoE